MSNDLTVITVVEGAHDLLDLMLSSIYKFTDLIPKVIICNNSDNKLDGNWEAFFPDEEQGDKWDESNPQLTLFLTFLKLFQHSQQHINTLTQKHLDYIYKEVLRFTEKPEVSDKAHVIFELAKFADDHLVKAGTLLTAG